MIFKLLSIICFINAVKENMKLRKLLCGSALKCVIEMKLTLLMCFGGFKFLMITICHKFCHDLFHKEVSK